MAVDISTGVSLDVGPALAALDKLGGAGASLSSEFAKNNAAIAQSFGPIAQSLGDITAESRAASAAQRQFAGDISGLVKDLRDQAAAQRDAQRAAALAASERQKASAAAREAARVEKAAAKELEDAEKRVAAAAKQAAAEAAKAAQQVAKESEAASQKTGGFLSTIAGGFGIPLGIAAAIAAVKQFGNQVVETAQATESTLSKLTFANGGDTQAAARDFAFIRSQADRLGLEINSVGKSYGNFTTAAAAANFPLAESRKLFLATAGASATLKLSADDTQGVLLALTQILSKGTVAAEELRGQIGERLPGAFAVAARAMNVTEAQLNKLLQTGQVKSTDFLPKFAAELQKTFGDGTAQAADSFSANLGRIENEFSAFFLRFEGIAASGLSSVGKFARRFNENIDNMSVEGRKRLGEKQAQGAIEDYSVVLAGLVADAEKQATAANTSVGEAISKVLSGQTARITAQLAEAQKVVAAIEEKRKAADSVGIGGRLLNMLDSRPNAAILQQDLADKRQEVAANKRVTALSGELAKLQEVAEARKKADNPADLEGLIKKQEDLIKALKVRQKAATQENQGGGVDFLLGKGGLDEQLKAAEKELARLEGKVDKTAKAAADKLAAALRALEAARVELTTKAAQAIIKESDDASVRARLGFEESLRQASLLEKQLQAREAAVKKAGGTGRNADGVIDGPDAQHLSELRLAALDKYYEALHKITKEQEQRLFDLRAATDSKAVDEVNRRFDKLLAAQHIGQSAEFEALDEAAGIALDKARKRSQEEIAIEQARQRELLKLQFEQQAKKDDQTATIATAVATTVGATFGEGTGVSVIAAKRAEKKALLEIEQQHARDVQNNSLLLNGKEGEIARANAAATIARTSSELKAIEQEKAKHKATDGVYKFLFGADDSDELRAQFEQTTQQAVGAINQILSAQLEAEQAKVQAHQENIVSLQSQLAAEIQLNQQGSASNIKGIQEQIAAERDAKRAALAESREIAKQQQLVNDLQSASSLALAVANIIAGWSTVPIAGSILGLVAAAATVASFVATKSSLASQTQTSGSFYRGGYTGGESEKEERGVVHGKEFVHTAEKTVRYRTLFDALHNDTPTIINWELPQYRALLPKAPPALLPDLGLPDKLRAERAQSLRVQHEHSFTPMQAQFDRMHERLVAIEKSNSRMADRPERLPLGNNKYIEIEENGSTHVKDLG